MELPAGYVVILIPPSHKRADKFSDRELWTARYGDHVGKGRSQASAMEDLRAKLAAL